MTELCDLATKYWTDKCPEGWNYTPVYFEWLGHYRDQVKTVLEIGIYRGASLRMWRDFFPNARVYGVDINEGCCFSEDRINSFCCDAYNPEHIQRIKDEIGPIDFCVDDAEHLHPHQAFLLRNLWPAISPYNVYAVEETRSYKDLKRVISSLNYVSKVKNFEQPSPNRTEEDRKGNSFYSLTLLRKGE